MILGIDEVGRGPWAGPLVVGAVVLGGATIDGLTDSKKLSKKRREELDIVIRESVAGYGLGWVTAHEIDEIGLSEALRLATRRAVEQITVPYHEIIIDGTVNFLAGTSKERYVTTMKKADMLMPSVSAASIIAKVARDQYMVEQDAAYPGYKFSSHVGYGTAVHQVAIEKLGVTPLHRLSFAPLAKYARINTPLASSPISEKSARSALAAGLVGRSAPKNFSSKLKTFLGAAPSSATRAGVDHDSVAGKALSFSGLTRETRKNMNGNPDYPIKSNNDSGDTTKKIGDRAEDEATNYLVRRGHEILKRNWKTKYCEIDIVSIKNDTVYFTEVKYRKTPNQGGGMAAITAKKLNQMKFAANYFAQAQNIKDTDLLLAVISLTGNPPDVEEYIELK